MLLHHRRLGGQGHLLEPVVHGAKPSVLCFIFCSHAIWRYYGTYSVPQERWVLGRGFTFTFWEIPWCNRGHTELTGDTMPVDVIAACSIFVDC